ncbi:MAG TPA: hypothetical protein O0W95_05340 [Methanocorpusculum sp.]|nr:hypothetical protein [Methanocorpusculum sp.]
MVTSSFETPNKILSAAALVCTGIALLLYIIRLCAVTFMVLPLDITLISPITIAAFVMMVIGIILLCVSMAKKIGSSKMNNAAEILIALCAVCALISIFLA